MSRSQRWFVVTGEIAIDMARVVMTRWERTEVSSPGRLLITLEGTTDKPFLPRDLGEAFLKALTTCSESD